MLRTRTEAILTADSWCEVQESSVLTILQQDTLNIKSEASLFSACQRWAQQQWDVKNKACIKKTKRDQKLRKILNPLLPYLRILSLTSRQFEAIQNDDVFSGHEQQVILECLAYPRKYKAVKGLCEIKTRRKKPKIPQFISSKPMPSSHRIELIELQSDDSHSDAEDTQDERVNQFSCDICRKSYKTKDVLRWHITRHVNFRQFKCQMCDKAYSSKYELKKHFGSVKHASYMHLNAVCESSNKNVEKI
jgi:hypothetical protein